MKYIVFFICLAVFCLICGCKEETDSHSTDSHSKWNQSISTILKKTHTSVEELKKMESAVNNLRNNSMYIWDSNRTAAVNELKKILSQSKINNHDWEKLDVLLSIIKGNDEFISKISVYCDQAVKNKNWELLKLLKKNHCLSYQFSKDIIEKKELNYSHEDILKYYTVVNEKFDRHDVWDCKRIDLKTIKFIMENLAAGEDREYWQDIWKDENKRKYIKNHNVPEVILLHAAAKIGFVDNERALQLCHQIDCEPDNFKLLNYLLKWKQQTSKVWTLY